jgi:phosphoglycerol geranylgeranyltransferase
MQMSSSVFQKMMGNINMGRKALAFLIDPDDLNDQELHTAVNHAIENKVDFIFVGGSLVTTDRMSQVVEHIKSSTNIPCIIFPGNVIQVDGNADAILFLSLISGRNPELLIGQHVVAAPVLKRSKLEVISTGYMLINSGKPTSASYISHSMPIPNDKPSIAASTALAGEMLGMKLIYMDAGSGAEQPVAPKMIRSVRKAVSTPVIVGGGINHIAKAREAFEAGADVIVIGNGAQKNLAFLNEVADLVHLINEPLNVN